MKKFTIFMAAVLTTVHLTPFFTVKAADATPPDIKALDLKGSKYINEVIVKYEGDDDSINKIKVKSSSEVQKTIARYKKTSDVELVQPNYIYKASFTNDSYRSNQWGLDFVEAEPAWAANPLQGKGVKIAVLDTGIDYNHPDLSSNVIGGFNSIGGTGYDDDNGHGTHVAGIIGAIPNNGLGIAGVAGQASLLAAKVLDKDGYGTSESISKGIYWSVDNGANVINLSFGSDENDPLISQAIDYAYEKGCIIVAAAGNTSDKVAFPARYNKVIAVSALNEANGLADFSNYGSEITVAAPGVNIISTVPSHSSTIGLKNYGIMSGTSMAAPFVSGVAALIKAQNPDITSDRIKQKLIESTNDLGIKGFDIMYGYGAINSLKALGGTSSSIYRKLTGDAFEDNNGYIAAKSFNTSYTISGNIYPESDIDWYKLVVPAGAGASVGFNSPSAVNNQIYILGGAVNNPTIQYYSAGNGSMKIPASNIEKTYYVCILDENGEKSTENYTVKYAINKPLPVITIDGVKNGGIYNKTVSPRITVANGSYSAKLNGSSYLSGTAVGADGTYTLAVTASNSLGDTVKSSLSFTIDKTAPKLESMTTYYSYKLSSKVPIKFKSNEAGKFGVRIYDSKWRLIKDIPATTQLVQGVNTFYWDGKDKNGRKITSSGTYYATVYGHDNVGNTFKSVNSTVIFDSNSPGLSLYTKNSSFKASSGLHLRVKTTEAAYLTVSIYDSRGRLIKQLSSNQYKNSGYNYFTWNGKNSSGKYTYKGTYYAKVYAKDKTGNTSYSSLRLNVK